MFQSKSKTVTIDYLHVKTINPRKEVMHYLQKENVVRMWFIIDNHSNWM